MRPLEEISAGVARLPVGIANVYLAGDQAAGEWVLIDTGPPGKARHIRLAAAARYGADSTPKAILLTHGHFDHSGSALDLANYWNAPVYAHPLEMPYLTGKSRYPPSDYTAPGLLAFLARFVEPPAIDLGSRVRVLADGAAVPGLPRWEAHWTPGHSPGHVAFFRPEDATLLAGDAFSTVDLDSLVAVISKRRRICRPPTPSTCDWKAAEQSVRKLDALNPLTLACGHGEPMSGPEAAEEFERFAYRFPVPAHGRYVAEPARTDDSGVRSLPPAPKDRAPAVAGSIGIAALAGAMVAFAAQRRRKRFETTEA